MAVAGVAAAALASPLTAAQALEFNVGDAVLVVYGNGTEYYRDLGAESTLLSNPSTTLTIDSSFMSQLGGASPIKYTIFGGNAANFGATPTSTFEGSKIPSTNVSTLSGWTAARNGAIDQGQLWNTLVNWHGQVSTIAGSEGVLAASDTRSFSSFFGTADHLAGSFPLQMSSAIDSQLFLLGRTFLPVGTQTAQSGLASALLSSAGNFTFTPGAAPVPIPAAVVLFGSGLIGLIGIARRSRSRSQA
ncbi:hypothetical protein AYO43_00030 [Nitrospira sp. SCGC AG-212-E16]|nr:hypothetical protein AYO43_00030 [Nitrospira sp. SCGC AG-212-E16]